MPDPRPESTSRALQVAVVAATALLVYANALGNGYAFDDQWVIQDNPIVQAYSWPEIFTSTYSPGPVYRPLTLLTFAIGERLGINPLAGHAFNVLLHALASCLVYALAMRLQTRRGAAFAAAMLFAVHPIHTEAVAGLVGRAELLGALSALTALLCFARSLENTRRAGLWLAASISVFAIGPFAKENTLTILPLIILWHWYKRPNDTLVQRVAVGGAFVAAALFYLSIRLYVTKALTYPTPFPPLDNPLAHVPSGVRISTAVVVLFDYAGLLLAPLVLSADYSFNQVKLVSSALDPRFLLAAAVFAVFALALWLGRRRHPVLIACASFFACTLSLTSNLLFPIGTIKAERLLYLPSVGFCIAVGYAAATMAGRWPRQTRAMLAAVLLLLAGRTWARNWDWRDNATLFAATVQSAPDSAKAQYNYGTVLQDRGEIDDAMHHFRAALSIYPMYRQAAFAIGKAYELKHIPAGALHWYAKATEIDWETTSAHLQTGLIRQQLGEYAAAEAAFRTGLDQQPDNPFLLLALGATRMQQGDRWEAYRLTRTYDELTWTKPRYREQYAELRHQLGRALNL